MKQLESLRAKIIKYVPEIKDGYSYNIPTHDINACVYCKTGIEQIVKDRAITLEDVLVALPSEEKVGYKKVDLTVDNNGETLFIDYKGISCNWQLNKPLQDQSPETIKSLDNLIE